MRWSSVFSKVKRRQSLVEERRIGVEGHGAASISSSTTTDNDHRDGDSDGEPIPAPLPQHQANTGFGALPLDLFSSIIELAISVESEFPPAYDVRALLVVNAVCRHWRWAALSTPSLWSYIPSRLPTSLVQLFAKRSGDALLHVDLRLVCYNWAMHASTNHNLQCDCKLDEFLAKLAILLRNSDRIRYISLSLPISALIAIDSEMAGTHCRTPVLEGLRFQDSANFPDLAWGLPREKQVADAELSIFKKFRSPLLRELHLNGMMVPHDCIPVVSLSRLSLQLSGSDTQIMVEEYVVNVLKEGSSLVDLSLDIWSIMIVARPPGHNETTSTTSNPIPLPQLRKLTLKGVFDQCLFAYRMLSAPLLEEIQLETKYSNFENAAQLFPLRPERDLVRVSLDDRTIHVEFTDSGQTSRSAGGRFLFTLSTPYSIGFGNISQLFPALLKTHHFAEIAFLDICISQPFDHAFMPSLLPFFGTLHSLRMSFAGGSQKVCPIEDAVDLSLLRSPSSSLRSLQSLIFHNFAVTMPQASPFLIELSAIIRGRAREGLSPLVPEFENCQGVTDALLLACGFKSSRPIFG